MGHGDHRPGEGLQIGLQNGQGGHVQVVGGLVQQQDVGGLHEHRQQVQPPALPAGELADGLPWSWVGKRNRSIIWAAEKFPSRVFTSPAMLWIKSYTR